MGVSIREKEKGSGVWWIFIRHNNQRKAKKIGAKALAQKAKTIMEARLIANDLGFFDEEEDKLLFKDCAKIWIKDVVPATCKNSTTVRYQCVLRKHLKQFNPTPIDEISRMDVKRFLLKKLSSWLSKSSVNYMKNALSGIFYVAIDSEVIQYNPTSGLRLKLTSRNSKPPVVPLDKQELNLLLNTFVECQAGTLPSYITTCTIRYEDWGSTCTSMGRHRFQQSTNYSAARGCPEQDRRFNEKP